MVSSRTVFWLLLASLLALQVLAEIGTLAEVGLPGGDDEHALGRLKRSPLPSSPNGNSHGNIHGKTHGKKTAKKSATKNHEKAKMKPKSKFAKRSNADNSRRNRKDQSKKSSRRLKSH